MGLLDKRTALKPYEYPELQQFVEAIQKTYWIHNEIDFSTDVHQFKIELTDTERFIIGTILKSFAQTEVFVYDEFWSQIGKYLPKPEVHWLSSTFSENEWRHATAYARLNEILGLENYEEFLRDPILEERYENLSEVGTGSPQDIMRVLAVFGCFTEYVNLFSQFAILKSFSCNGRNLFPNIGNIIDWSARDEDAHAKAAMYLFNQMVKEYPQYWTNELKSDIYNAARVTFEIEMKLIDQIFSEGELPNLTKEELVNFMKNRINEALINIGLKEIYTIDRNMLKGMSWFLDDIFQLQHTDFFAKRPTEYAKFNQVYDANTVLVDKSEVDMI